MKTPMDYELEYMEHLFDSIKSKKTESYVIHRIWNKLDDDRVRFVTQQKITLPNGKYALADLYLPQLKIFVEVNEPYHDKQKDQDKYRNEKIVELTEADQFIIECGKGTDKCEWKSLSEIHQQIDECVTFIKKRITDVGDQLKPWSMSESLTVEFHKNKGCLNVDGHDALRTIDDICRLTGGVKRDRGFLRAGTAGLPQHPDMELWFPCVNNRSNWLNEKSDDGQTICESNTKDPKKNYDHIEDSIKKNLQRVTFFKFKDNLGIENYFFLGIFRIDAEASRKDKKCVWRRVSTEYKL